MTAPPAPLSRRCALFGLLLAPALPRVAGAAAPSAPPNLVPISARITTSGQPPAPWLETLKAQGFKAVIYLAPMTVPEAVPEEPAILARQGIAFVHLPIPLDGPRDSDYDDFVAAMKRHASQKVLVHCQVNFRASSMVFLYRSIVLKEDPESAYDAVSRVWSPNRPWKAMIVGQLRRHGIAFEPY